MDNFNRIASFVLGLVVVIVFLAVISGRLGFGKKTNSLSTQTKVSPTVGPTTAMRAYVSPTPIVRLVTSPTRTIAYNNVNNNTKSPTTIPSTGSPTLLLPILFSALGSGLYLRRKTKKD